MTISPPANVNPSEVAPRVLASGIDTLVLALDVVWANDKAFQKLAELKAEARAAEADRPGVIRPKGSDAPYVYTCRPHGRDGYEWLLESGEFAMRIGNWLEPKSRPSVMVEIRSETLWTHGPRSCVERVHSLLEAAGAMVVRTKASRADLCCDVLLPASVWVLDLIKRFVKLADIVAPYLKGDKLTGVQVGRGQICARLYDKALEIRTKSHKFWMFDIWKLDRIEDSQRAVRVEFQLRREALKELGIDGFDDLMSNLQNIWAYCTRQWLKVQDDPQKHHTQQTTVPWWRVVQSGYGDPQAHPTIRAKAIRQDELQQAQQLLGYATSLTALWRQGELIAPDEQLDLGSHLAAVIDAAKRAGLTDREFTARVKRKQAKSIRHSEKFEAAQRARAAMGATVKQGRKG